MRPSCGMTSWREDASTDAQAELDALLNVALPPAQDLLGKHGEFYPFSAVITHAGEPRLIEVPMETKNPDSAQVIERLYFSLRAHAPSIHAGAVAADVRLPDGTGAIQVDLEHREGTALRILLPYHLSEGSIVYGDIAASQGDRHIWNPSSP